MSIKRIETVASYVVIRPNGAEEIVDVTQQIISAASMSDPNGEIPGMKSAKLRGSNHVNHNKDGSFMDIATGETLEIVSEL